MELQQGVFAHKTRLFFASNTEFTPLFSLQFKVNDDDEVTLPLPPTSCAYLCLTPISCVNTDFLSVFCQWKKSKKGGCFFEVYMRSYIKTQ